MDHTKKTHMTAWTPVRQWAIPLAILFCALCLHWSNLSAEWSYYTCFVSLLMLAFMNPVINALRPQLLKNLGVSILIFAAHAGLCLLFFRMIKNGIELQIQLFMAILVFYLMATMLSLLFRGIYKLVSEVL